MDVRMPGLDGIAATRRVLAAADEGAVRVLRPPPSTSTSTSTTRWRPGAGGFLLKDVPPEQLAEGIRVVDNELLAPSITRRLIQEFAQATAAGRRPKDGWALSRCSS